MADLFENKKRSQQAKELACFKNEAEADCKARLEGMGWTFPATAKLADQKWAVPEEEVEPDVKSEESA